MLAAFILVIAAEPLPRTVNDQVLGTAEQFSTAGPAKVCMRDMALKPVAGERVVLEYSGIHNGSLRLETVRGNAVFTLHEILAARKFRGELVRDDGASKAYLDEFDGRPALYVWKRDADEDSNRRWRVHSVISGELVAKEDFALLWQRVIFGVDQEANDCTRVYRFGWGVILGDEALSEKHGE